MPRWEVPYESPGRTTSRYVIAAVFSAASAIMLGRLLSGGPRPLSIWIFVLVLIPVFVLMAWRISLVGVWIGEPGVRVNMVIRTRLVRWPEFDRVWLGPATGYDALALWISTRDGADIETPVWRADSRILRRQRNRTRLEQHELSALMERLRTEARRNT